MLDQLLPKYQKQIICVCVVAYCLPSISAAIMGPSYIQPLVGCILSLVLFPIGYVMGSFVLGLQIKNPVSSKKSLATFCKMTIYFFGGATVFLGLSSSYAILSSRIPAEEMVINGIAGGLGIAFAAYKIRNQNIISQE